MKREKLETAKRSRGQGFKGHIPWNKGITKKNDPRVGRKQGIRIIVNCDACGKELKRHPCHVRKNKDGHNFCDSKCQSIFRGSLKKKRNYKKRLAFVLDPNVKCFWCGKPANYMFSTGNACCESRPFRCSGFSTHSGSENGMYGKNHKDESKQLMSENNAMKHAETVKKVSESLTGKKKSPEHCKAISEGKKGLYTGSDNPMYGKERSEKAKKLTSEANKGEKNFFFGKRFFGEDNPFFGKIHTKKSRDIMSAKTSLENHPRWRGGTSFEPYGIEFNDQLREEIRERDKYTCQFCGRTSKQNLKDFGCRLHVHHIDYDKGKNSKTNLITLCKSCHSHTYTNNEFWQDFYEDLMRKKQMEEASNL